MKIMGHTIIGATSGELALATPKDSQSQVEGQKTTKSNRFYCWHWDGSYNSDLFYF